MHYNIGLNLGNGWLEIGVYYLEGPIEKKQPELYITYHPLIFIPMASISYQDSLISIQRVNEH
jgi:hypothetical protein